MRAVVGLGSNVGDREAMLRSALSSLARVVTIERVSRVYDTAPVGPPQDRYLNAAALVRFALTPRGLLEALLAIEASLGRVRRERWGPRTIDLDILWIEGATVDEPGLTVPHPELTRRAFALLPMLEVAPFAVDPRSGAAYAGLPVDASGVVIAGSITRDED